MDPLLKKFNFKGQPHIYVLGAPASLQSQIEAFAAEAPVFADPAEIGEELEFVMAFATQQAQVDAFAQRIGPRLKGDAVFWMLYPKGSSKRYQCDFNRDTGWDALGKVGLEPVRQVAFDEDWSALRFRKVQYIKTMTRSFAMTEEGKAKAQNKG
jgi:hypothetical protein